MCSYPCFGLSKIGFTPPSQLLKLIIFFLKQKLRRCRCRNQQPKLRRCDQEIGNENYIAADPEIGSQNCFAADQEIGSEN
jgi:hypothetical protein